MSTMVHPSTFNKCRFFFLLNFDINIIRTKSLRDNCEHLCVTIFIRSFCITKSYTVCTVLYARFRIDWLNEVLLYRNILYCVFPSALTG